MSIGTRWMGPVILLVWGVPASAQIGQGGQPRSGSVDVHWGSYQDARDGRQQSEHLSRTITIGERGWLDLSNISGDIIVTGTSGGDVVVEATKRARSRDGRARELLDSLTVEIVERPGRADVRTVHPRGSGRGSAWVDYNVRVPSQAQVNLKSVSGDIRVTSVQGELRVESVSGDVQVSSATGLAFVRSVSGDVQLFDVGSDAGVTAMSVSGDLIARGLVARSIEANTVSGELTLENVQCERAEIRTVSGTVEYAGSLTSNGRYELHAHSGDIRLAVPDDVGFELDANTFSGTVHSHLPVRIGGSDGRGRDGSRGSRAIRGTFGDGSALVFVRTFSGDVTISRR